MNYNGAMKIGPYHLAAPLILAPMAGVTDRPFRMLCARMGAGMTVSEMVTSNKQLWHTRKTRLRLDHSGEQEPRSVQIAGTDPAQLAEAARFNVDHGAQIIDINMGCPAKKVCNVMAGSALLRDELLVGRILEAVVNAVDVPVTLKIRTGWDPENRNGLAVASIAEQAGIQALTVHGRTRACAFRGSAEHDTTRVIKAAVAIPVIANGDIDSAESAQAVLQYTAADAVMIGRAAQGQPWLFRDIVHYLETGRHMPDPEPQEICRILTGHLDNLYRFYGEYTGVRVARKHIAWYSKGKRDGNAFRQQIYRLESSVAQLQCVREYFARLGEQQGLAA